MNVLLDKPPAGATDSFPLSPLMCGWCQSWHAIEQQAVPQGQPQGDAHWLCPTCRRKRPVLQVRPGGRCRHVDHQHGPGSVLLILEADGEYVTVQRLGQPGYGGYDGRSRYRRSELVAAGDCR